MKNLKLCLLLLFALLIGCSSKVTGADLIGGYWLGTAGYEDGKPKGDPYCAPFSEGLEFKDETTVYVEAYDRDFEYELVDGKHGRIIEFTGKGLGLYLRYYIDKVTEDALGLRGVGELQEDESCYLERNSLTD